MVNQFLVNQFLLHKMLDSFEKIEIKSPVDLIISQINNLIKSGALKPGDRLPSERKLAEHLGVTRTQVRDAINKLQFYGIVRVNPQSGTVVNGIGITALEGLITDILNLEKTGFKPLVETRILLEKEAARLAAINRTENDIIVLTDALQSYKSKLHGGEVAVEEDLLFHIKIAEASGNPVLKSLMMIITPDIVHNFLRLKVCNESNNNKTIKQHQKILDKIIEQDAEGAISAMEDHLSNLKEFSQ